MENNKKKLIIYFSIPILFSLFLVAIVWLTLNLNIPFFKDFILKTLIGKILLTVIFFLSIFESTILLFGLYTGEIFQAMTINIYKTRISDIARKEKSIFKRTKIFIYCLALFPYMCQSCGKFMFYNKDSAIVDNICKKCAPKVIRSSMKWWFVIFPLCVLVAVLIVIIYDLIFLAPK